jgi:hypothetical protein
MASLLAAKTPAHRLRSVTHLAAKTMQGTGPHPVMTVTGPPIPITHGVVQVRITVAAGRITRVAAIRLPHDNDDSWARSLQAARVLAREAMTAQSAHVDAVTGASYTSRAYIRSLQAAIDAATVGTPKSHP